MKIAYLISAHTDPNHLERLIRALDDNQTEFFIHLDARADKKQFASIVSHPKVTFLKKRTRVLWGDITQVDYQIELLRTCLKSKNRAHFLQTYYSAPFLAIIFQTTLIPLKARLNNWVCCRNI